MRIFIIALLLNFKISDEYNLFHKKHLSQIIHLVLIRHSRRVMDNTFENSLLDLSVDIDNICSSLTIEEKISLCSGHDVWRTKHIKRLNVPSIHLTDGPHGLRKQILESDNIGLYDSIPATCYPTASMLAATWNKSLIKEVGEELALECISENVNVLLGPGINIKRSPLCGRNFEYFSEDPYLTSELAIPMIMGIQSHGVGACLKHFAVNNQEKFRMTIDAIVDEQALHEIYLYAFEKTIKASHPMSLMVSYNKLNGSYTSENSYLLKTFLRENLNYEGVVVTDWGATSDRVSSLNLGVDLEMPSSGKLHDSLLLDAVRKGTLDISELDKSVKRILKLAFNTYKSNINPLAIIKNKLMTKNQQNKIRHRLARKVASEGIVLLKNSNNILPIDSRKHIAIIGQFAKHPKYQGGGSSKINPFKIETLYHIAKKSHKSDITYAKGYSLNSDKVDISLINEAKEISQNADLVIIMAGLPDAYESEGFDRKDLKLPANHDFLINEISKINSNVIVILSNGSPVEMPWIGSVKAVVESYLSGQAGASALWDCLIGKTNPSGKIAETFPIDSNKDLASKYFPMGSDMVDYRESIFVGYRYYDKLDSLKSNFSENVLFPFGHGLSYTVFSYSSIMLQYKSFNIDSSKTMNVSFDIKNTGKVAGTEISQVYVSYFSSNKEDCLSIPQKELKGFEKIHLFPNEKKTVKITLDKSAFSFFDRNEGRFRVRNGSYNILIGASSRDIRLSGQVFVYDATSEETPKDTHPNDTNWYYNSLFNEKYISREDFYKFLNKDFPKFTIHSSKFSRNSTLEELSHKSILFKILMFVIMIKINSIAKNNTSQKIMMKKFILDMPIRGIALMSKGLIKYKVIDFLIMWLNKNRWQAIKFLFK